VIFVGEQSSITERDLFTSASNPKRNVRTSLAEKCRPRLLQPHRTYELFRMGLLWKSGDDTFSHNNDEHNHLLV